MAQWTNKCLRCWGVSLQFDRKWRHNPLPLGSKSHKREGAPYISCHVRIVDFLITVQSISKWFRPTVLERVNEGLHLLLLCDALLDIFASWPRKLYSRGPTVVYALGLTCMADLDFVENCAGSHRLKSVTPEGIHISTGNDVISYFHSAANRVHATAAVTDFTLTKWSFWENLGKYQS